MKSFTKLSFLLFRIIFLPCLLQAADKTIKLPNNGKQFIHDSLSSNTITVTPPQKAQIFNKTDENDDDGTIFMTPYYQITPSKESKSKPGFTIKDSPTLSLTKTSSKHPQNNSPETEKEMRDPSPSPALRLKSHNSDKIMEECGIEGKSNKKKLKKIGTLNDKHSLKDDLKKTQKEFKRFKKGSGVCITFLGTIIIILSAIIGTKQY